MCERERETERDRDRERDREKGQRQEEGGSLVLRSLIARESQQPWIDREGASYELPMTLPQPVIAEPFSFLIRTVCRHSFFLETSIDQVCTEG